jgi:hypothetical protein
VELPDPFDMYAPVRTRSGPETNTRVLYVVQPVLGLKTIPWDTGWKVVDGTPMVRLGEMDVSFWTGMNKGIVPGTEQWVPATGRWLRSFQQTENGWIYPGANAARQQNNFTAMGDMKRANSQGEKIAMGYWGTIGVVAGGFTYGPAAVAYLNNASINSYVAVTNSIQNSSKIAGAVRTGSALLGGYHLYNFSTDPEYAAETISVDSGLGFSSVYFAADDLYSSGRYVYNESVSFMRMKQVNRWAQNARAAGHSTVMAGYNRSTESIATNIPASSYNGKFDIIELGPLAFDQPVSPEAIFAHEVAEAAMYNFNPNLWRSRLLREFNASSTASKYIWISDQSSSDLFLDSLHRLLKGGHAVGHGN